MRSLRRFSSRKSSPLPRLLFAAVFVVALLGFDALSGGRLRGPARSVAAGLSAAAENVDSSVSRSGFFSTRRSLATENEMLRGEVERLRVEASAASALRDENAQLQALVHVPEHAAGIGAPVVSSAPSFPYGTFLVGAGVESGVHAGDLVFSADGFAIGRVSDAQSGTSLVTELFAPGATLPVILAQGQLTLEGKGDAEARATAPRALSFNEGDIATAPSLGGAPVGVVGKVESDPASAYKTVYVRVPANLQTLRFVYIRKP